MALRGEFLGGLEEERGLSDSRFSTQEDYLTLDETSPQDAVQLADARGDSALFEG